MLLYDATISVYMDTLERDMERLVIDESRHKKMKFFVKKCLFFHHFLGFVIFNMKG